MAKKPIIHRAEQYAEDVRSGKQIACHWVQQAVERYYRDLDNAVEKGWYFDRQAAERAINFVEKCKHIKGEFANHHIQLEPWQCFCIWNLFGFRMASNGFRRFRKSYISVAKKNGKTTLAAPISLYMGIADKEVGAEVYYAATTRDQARICFESAKLMVERSDLWQICTTTKNAIVYDRLASVFQPVSSEASNMEGKSVHCAILDEYHQHPTDEAFDLLQNGTVSRTSPLLFVITTAGLNLSYPCYAYDQLMRKMLDGVIEDDRTFAIIYTLDNEDEVHDEKMWVKANPCMGHSLSVDALRDQYKQMRNAAYKTATILTKHFNMWVDAPTVWLTNAQWGKENSIVPQSSLLGCKCTAALDLASTGDFCSYVLLFNEAGRYQFIWRFFIPEEKYATRYDMQREHSSISQWVDEGFLTITEGNVTDYDYIIDSLCQDVSRFNVQKLAYDPWNSSQIIPKLVERGLPCEPFTQTIGNFALPTKEFERIVLKGIVDHYDNPVARWMLSNVVIKEDVNGNRRPDKSKSSEKIDGIVAAIMALGQHLSDNAEQLSVYATRGIVGDDGEDNDDFEFDLDDFDYGDDE